jgi:hypothetical protein
VATARPRDEHSVLNRCVNTVNPTQCLQHSNFNTVNELALRTHQLDTFFQHSVLGCCPKHCVTGQWRCGLDCSFETGCICCLLPTFGLCLACGQCLVLTAKSGLSRPPQNAAVRHAEAVIRCNRESAALWFLLCSSLMVIDKVGL